MEEEVELHSPTSRKDSDSSGFFEVPLTPPETSPTLSVRRDMITPKPVSEHPTVRKTTSLKKKDSQSVFDGALQMGYIWYYNQENMEKKSPEEIRLKAQEEKLGRILRLDPQKHKAVWKKYFAVIYNDGRFAWYRPARMNLYNKRVTGELEEVLFIPWRVCAFGSDVIKKLCLNCEANERSSSAPVSPRILGSSPPSFASILESATNCICGSPSISSLMSPSLASTSKDPEAISHTLPKASRESLLMAVGGHDWSKGDVYCFATESEEDLEIWRESFALLSHRKIVEKSAFDHLLNTPVMITLPYLQH